MAARRERQKDFLKYQFALTKSGTYSLDAILDLNMCRKSSQKSSLDGRAIPLIQKPRTPPLIALWMSRKRENVAFGALALRLERKVVVGNN